MCAVRDRFFHLSVIIFVHKRVLPKVYVKIFKKIKDLTRLLFDFADLLTFLKVRFLFLSCSDINWREIETLVIVKKL